MCDGEESQIRVFQEEEIRQLFNQNLIDFGKTPASCSAITQSSDVSMFFKATKQVLKGICDTNYRNNLLERNLKYGFEQLRLRHGTSFTSATENRIVDALQRIVFTIHKTINPEIIINGYRECGQDAPISLNTNGQPTMEKYEKAISKCTTQLSVLQCQILKDNFHHFVEIMRLRGRITEAEYDAKGVPTFKEYDSDKNPKDERALHKQRACIMNADIVIAQFINYQQQRTIRLQELENRRLQRTATADERQRAKEAKAAEKLRRSTLTEEQKREESNTKRRATMARKLAERQEAAQILRNAENILRIVNIDVPELSEYSWNYSRDNNSEQNEVHSEIDFDEAL